MLIIITLLLLGCYIYLGWKHPAIALVTSPFVAGVLILMGIADENFAIMFISPWIFIITTTTVMLSKSESGEEQWPRQFAKWILIFLLFLFLTVVLGVVFGPLGVSGIVLCIIFIASIIAYGLTSRLATDAYVISTIGSIMRQNLPLSMALDSAAAGGADNRSIILSRIQKWLVQGYSLSESIKRGYPKCPGHAVAMIAAAERINQLPLAIQAIEADMITKADERRKIRPVHPIYPVILIVFMFFMLLGLMTFVIPSFQTALEEMGVAKFPAATRFLIEITRLIGYEYAWLLWSLVVLLVLVIIPFSIYIKFRPRRPFKPHLVSRMGDFVKWHSPVLHSFEKNYSLIQVIELLRISLNAGCTVNEAIRNTLGLDVNNCFKKRLQRWLQKVERGVNIAAAIRQSKLGAPLAWAFDEKVNQGNTMMILETLESFYRSNYSYVVNLARFIMWPCVILVMGLIVGFVVYAVFLPGVYIIESLSGKVIP